MTAEIIKELTTTEGNKDLNWEHRYKYISHYWHMALTNKYAPTTLHIYVPLHLYCSIHIDSTLLHTSTKYQNCNICLIYYCRKCASNKYATEMPYMPYAKIT